jgi:hypothetical protein
VKTAGEIAVICDFSETYSFIQNELKSFQWNNVQATLHPFVVHYSQNEMTHPSILLLY